MIHHNLPVQHQHAARGLQSLRWRSGLSLNLLDAPPSFGSLCRLLRVSGSRVRSVTSVTFGLVKFSVKTEQRNRRFSQAFFLMGGLAEWLFFLSSLLLVSTEEAWSFRRCIFERRGATLECSCWGVFFSFRWCHLLLTKILMFPDLFHWNSIQMWWILKMKICRTRRGKKCESRWRNREKLCGVKHLKVRVLLFWAAHEAQMTYFRGNVKPPSEMTPSFYLWDWRPEWCHPVRFCYQVKPWRVLVQEHQPTLEVLQLLSVCRSRLKSCKHETLTFLID